MPVELLTCRPGGRPAGVALEELGGVEELIAAREPEDPGVAQERVDHVFAAQRRRAVSAPRRARRLGAGGL